MNKNASQVDNVCIDIDECFEEMKDCYDPNAWKLSRMEFRNELNLFSSKCINLIGSSSCECRETFTADTQSETYACIPRAPYAVHQMTHYDSKIMNRQFSNTTLSANGTFVIDEMSQTDTQSFKLRGQLEENRSIYADLCMTSLDKGSLEINFYTMAQVGFRMEQSFIIYRALFRHPIQELHSEKFLKNHKSCLSRSKLSKIRIPLFN